MTIATDFEIQPGKNIRYIGAAHGVTGAGYYTVISLHRHLSDLSDDISATPDDYVDITRDTPSDRSTDNIISLLNGYNIDQTASEHLYGGSIIQTNGDEIWDGMKIYANPDMNLQIHQNGVILTNDFWNAIPFGTGLIGLNPDAANGVSHQFLLRVRTAAADIDGRRLICQTRVWSKTYSEFPINGTSRGENVAALTYADDLNNVTSIGALTASPFTTISNLKQGYSLLDVNNDAANEAYYSEWTRGTASINQFYEYIKYVANINAAATLYGLPGEQFRGITHEITLSARTGTFAEFEGVSWTGGTGQMLAIDSLTAGTKMWIQLLSGVAPTTTQVITGVSAATGTASGTAVEHPTPAKGTLPFCGTSTGSSIIGAYGFGIKVLDLSASDKVFDLTGTQRQPPNFVQFTVSNLVSGDRVLVAPLGYRFFYDAEATGPFVVGETLTFTTPAGTAKLVKLIDNGTTGEMWIGTMLSGSVPADNTTMLGGTSSATAAVNGTPSSDINLGQMNLNTTLTGAALTSIVMAAAIPTDTPLTGTIRVQHDSGIYTRHVYSAYTGSTFTITSSDFSTDNAAAGNNVFVSYLDVGTVLTSENFTSIYLADRSLFVRVRNGTGSPPIKTYESSASLGVAGGSATTSRISDA